MACRWGVTRIPWALNRAVSSSVDFTGATLSADIADQQLLLIGSAAAVRYRHRIVRIIVRASLTACLLAMATSFVVATPAGAADLTVTTEAEYRSALATLSANGSGPHTITLGADLTLATAGDPVYSGSTDLTINGDGHTITVTAPTTRALASTTPAAVTVNLTTITGAATTGNGGAISTAGPLTLNESYLHHNSASERGGAAFAGGVLSISRSTLADNTATTGGAASTDGRLSVEMSTLVDNTATTSGGGLHSDWVEPPPYAPGLSGAISTSLLYGNSAPAGSNVSAAGYLTGSYSVVGAPLGGGQNCDAEPYPPPDGWYISSGLWASDDSCQFGGWWDQHNLPDDLLLGPLADNGGPTPTRLPQPGSPLIDRAQVAGHINDCVTGTDQRGLPRPRGLQPATAKSGWGPVLVLYCDSGPVEAEAPQITAEMTSPLPAKVMTGAVTSITIRVTNLGPGSVVFDRLRHPAGSLADRTCEPSATPLPPGGVRDIGCDVPMYTSGDRAEVWAAGDSSYALAETDPLVVEICDPRDLPFNDVPPWARESTTWAYCLVEIASGYPDLTFRPGDPISRYEVARMLYRLDGSPDVTALDPLPFDDTAAWAIDAVRWINHDPGGAGELPPPLMAGFEDTFGGGEPITRGQLARVLWRYGEQPAAPDHSLTDVPPWLTDSVNWLAHDPDDEGPLEPIAVGYPDNTFRPDEPASRAQVVRMLQRLSNRP